MTDVECQKSHFRHSGFVMQCRKYGDVEIEYLTRQFYFGHMWGKAWNKKHTAYLRRELWLSSHQILLLVFNCFYILTVFFSPLISNRKWNFDWNFENQQKVWLNILKVFQFWCIFLSHCSCDSFFSGVYWKYKEKDLVNINIDAISEK